jgi:hypothetical protein
MVSHEEGISLAGQPSPYTPRARGVVVARISCLVARQGAALGQPGAHFERHSISDRRQHHHSGMTADVGAGTHRVAMPRCAAQLWLWPAWARRSQSDGRRVSLFELLVRGPQRCGWPGQRGPRQRPVTVSCMPSARLSESGAYWRSGNAVPRPSGRRAERGARRAAA